MVVYEKNNRVLRRGKLRAKFRYYKDEIKYLQSANNKKTVNLKTNSENVATIETLLKEIFDDVAGFALMANEMVVEYSNTLLNDAVQIVAYPETAKVTSNIISRTLALSALVGLFLSIFSAFLFEYIKNHRILVSKDRGFEVRPDDLIHEKSA